MELRTRWSSSVDLDELQAHFKRENLSREEIIHEAYAELLRSLAAKITLKNDEEQYIFAVPKSIVASTETNNLNVMLILTCTQDG